MRLVPTKTSWITVSPGMRWLRKEYFDKRVELVDEDVALREGFASPAVLETSVPDGGQKMSAETMTTKLTDDLTGKNNILATKIADVNTKMDAVFADAHAAVDLASAHVDKVAAAVARLKETLPT